MHLVQIPLNFNSPFNKHDHEMWKKLYTHSLIVFTHAVDVKYLCKQSYAALCSAVQNSFSAVLSMLTKTNKQTEATENVTFI